MAAVTRLGLYGGPRAPYAGFAAAAASVALTGTVTTATEADIVTGGKTIVLTVANDTWVATVGADNAITTALINGLDSDGAEATGWDAVVKAGLAFGDVARTSDTVVTITLPAFASYDITADETITATIPATALTAGNPIVASPTFDVSYVPVVADEVTTGGGKSRRRGRKYPRWVVINGQRYQVWSADEERQLLRAMAERAADAAKVAEGLGDKELAKEAKRRAVRIEKRIATVDDREEEWMQRLRDEDDEILLLFG